MIKQGLPLITAVLLVSSCLVHDGRDSKSKGVEGKNLVDRRLFILELHDSNGKAQGKRMMYVTGVVVKKDRKGLPSATIEFKESHVEGDFELIKNTKVEGDENKFIIEGKDSNNNTFHITAKAGSYMYIDKIKITKPNGDYLSEVAEKEYPLSFISYWECKCPHNHLPSGVWGEAPTLSPSLSWGFGGNAPNNHPPLQRGF